MASLDTVGALVLGGDYRALGVVRSLGRRGIPVWVARRDDDHRLAGVSRYCERELILAPSDDDGPARDQLLQLARDHDLSGWVLFASADPTAAFVARQHAALGGTFRLTTPAWDVFRWAYDKRRTAELADTLGVLRPWTTPVPTRDHVTGYEGPFPVVLKPATKPLRGPSKKAWQADDPAMLLKRYDEAARVTEPGALVLQELIPGHNHVHYSFAALCDHGRPIAAVTAERMRQYPLDFGRYSTFVQTIDDPDVERAGRRVLAGLELTGLAEVEFKRDPRDGSLRLLDINVRVWGWHTIARRAGLDFPYLAWRQAVGESVDELQAPEGLRWLRLTTDVPAGVRQIAAGHTAPWAYAKTLLGRHEQPVLAKDDLLPALSQLPLYAIALLRRHRGSVPPEPPEAARAACAAERRTQ